MKVKMKRVIKISGKRGSHVGIIISFVMFIIFLVFVFSILQPKLNFGQSKQSVVDYLSIELKSNFSENLTTIFVNATDPADQCMRLSNFLINASISSRLVVQNESSIVLDARVVGNDLEINKGNVNNFFFKVYESGLFNNSNDTDIPSCHPLQPEQDYFITLESTELYIFESRVNETIQDYKTDYDGVRKNFNIPTDTNFGFSFTNSRGEINEPVFSIPKSSNVYSDELPVLYVAKDGYIKPGFLTIEVW